MDTSDLTGRGYGALLWEPDQQTVHDARITRFMRWLADRGPDFTSYDDLWRWSVTQPAAFWAAVWDYFEVLGHRGAGPVLAGEVMPDVQWFTGATLNYARNALRTAWTDPDRTAIIFEAERPRAGHLSYAQLAHQVARVARGLRALGVRRGNRVAALLPNVPEAVIGLLATASIGAIWSSCSPDFGARSVIDRFAQIEPTVLIAGDGYWYGGKEFSRAQLVDEVLAELPGLSAVVLVDLIGQADSFPDRFVRWEDLGEGEREPEFEEVPFDHPLWVVYSSGTTGLPKPIMHGHGGIVLEHLKALAFHQDLRPGDVFTWYTTTGWMMWNYLAGGLLAGLTIVLYDGSATYPDTGRLWRLAAEHGVTYLGVGAPYLTACLKAGLRPGAQADLSALRAIGSTGSPLPPRPYPLARYRAASAAAISSAYSRLLPLSSAATPIDTVTCTRSPPVAPGAMIHRPAMADRTRSAIRKASTARVCGSSNVNSSPPNRPAKSYSRSSVFSVCAISLSTSSPVRCP